MSNHLTYTIREIIEELDGNGLIIVDIDELVDTLHDMGFTSETEVQTVELDD